MKRACIYISLVMISLFSEKVIAQSNDTARFWTLTDCITYASDNNLDISTQRLNEQVAEQDLLLSKGSKTPSLYGTVTNYFENAKNNITGNGLVSQLSSDGTYALSSSVVLWNDRYINNTIQQRQLSTQLANLKVQQSVNNITLQITSDYLSVLLSKEYLHYINDLLTTSEARVKQGEIFYKVGSIAKKDLLQLQAQLASDRYLMVQTQNSIRQTLLQLKQTLQLPPEVQFDIAVPNKISINKKVLPLDQVRQAALRDFPEKKIGELAADIASIDIKKASAGFKPTLAAGGTVATGYNSVLKHSILPKTAYLTQTSDNFYQRAGLTLSIPIFSNFSNKVARSKATIQYKQSLLNLQNYQLTLSQAVERAYLDAVNAIQSYEAAAEQLNAAEESYRISNEQFKLGSMNSYDLLQQRNQYVQAVQAFTQSKYSAVLQQKIYEFYLGKPVQL